MQRAVCRGPMTTGTGSCSSHSATCSGQRGANGQPGGRDPGAGARPGMAVSARAESMRGIAASNWREYGCAAAPNTAAAGPCSISRPAYITATWSAKLPTTDRSCETYSAAAPSMPVIRRTVASTCAWVVTSRPVVGSSSTTTAGLQAKAIAIVTRCCWPPDNSCG